MTTSYTTSELCNLSIRELKAIALTKQTKPTKDARHKQNWIDAIESADAGVVLTTDWLANDVESLTQVSDSAPTDEETEIEQGLKAALDALADAEQDAIFKNDQESARAFSEAYDRTLAEYQAVISVSIEKLARDSMPICEQGEQVRVNWEGESAGTVSIDYGATLRVFRVIDLFIPDPVIKVITSNGTEIDSRWQTTANNRYIKAIREAIPVRLAEMVEDICRHSLSRHGDPVAPLDYIYAGGGDGEGERRGGNGNGDDRGRITNDGRVTAADWPHDIYLF